MEFRFEYKTEEEKTQLLNSKTDEGLILVAIDNLVTGNFLVFSDIPYYHEETVLANIVIENETLTNYVLDMDYRLVLIEMGGM